MRLEKCLGKMKFEKENDKKEILELKKVEE